MSGIQQLLLAAKPQVVSDPNFDYTTLLLPGNGTNGAQNNTFLDSSTNNFTITRNGNTTQGTFSPFSQTGWGNFFDGTGDYLDAGTSTAFGLGTGDFTIEMWVYPTANPTNGTGTLFDLRTGATATACNARIDSSLNLLFYNGPANTEITVGTVALNTWTQIAFVRSSGTLRTYVNGTQTNSSTVSGDLGTTQACWIAANRTAGYNFNGYVSNFRIVKGTAVYTTNFTPSTTPLTAITNTSLLTCQSNRFVDNSSNAFAITRNGDVSVQAFSPFNPTAAWSAATYGGSGYFDGSGDWLSAPSNAAFDFSGDFTIELWFYATTVSPSFQGFCGRRLSAANFGPFSMGLSGASIIFSLSTSGSSWALNSTGGTATANSWNHVAFVRSGTACTAYLNGTSVITGTVSGALASSSQNLAIGTFTNDGTEAFNGYISSLRVVKGTAVYTANFTPPTAPLTAITNTSLLTNFTNAGIYDATSKNDLETVGNAQISTAQSKFGGSSIYFDGTGDYCNTGPTVNLEFGSGDFTIEMWIYPAVTSRMAIYHGSSGTDWSIGIDYNSQKFNIWASSNGTTWNLINADPGGNGIGTTTISTNTWTHVAFVRSGTTWQTYINGTRDINLTGISGSIVNRATSAKSIGKWWFSNGVGNPGVWNGYLQDVRITKGVARYTANFTPPTAAFPLL